MSFLPKDFEDYILPDQNRCEFIQNYLKKNGVNSNCIVINDKKHILVQYPSFFYNSKYKIKTVIAHYDRVKGSPGANDNSAADWMLMNWAIDLNKYNDFHNIRIFFTDGEELGWHNGVMEQGAFGIANTFKRLGITNEDVYVFDACGRGEVPVLAKTIMPSKIDPAFSSDFSELFNRAQDILSKACPGKWMALPVPYSDNASFLACGIPAVAITMLPADEVTLYARDIYNSKSLEDSVLNRERSHKERIENKIRDYSYKDRIPETWKLFHSEKDNIESLTPESFVIMKNILNTIAATRTVKQLC